MIFSIFRFFAPSHSKYCPVMNHASMEISFIQLLDDA